MDETLARKRWQTVDVDHPELYERGKQLAAERIGSIVVGSHVEQVPVDERSTFTFDSALREAGAGNAEAEQYVDVTIDTDIAERLFKAGHITEVQLKRTDNGIEQNDIPLTQISINTLLNMPLNWVMRNRTETELANATIFDLLMDAHLMDDYDVAVFSHTPEDNDTKYKYGFFTDTDTLSVQLLSATDGDITLETGFVSAKATPDGDRYDIPAVKSLLRDEGIELTGEGSEEMLQKIVLIPKGQLPDGMMSIVERYDDKIAQLNPEVNDVFFGEAKLKQNYQEYAEVCKARDFSDMTKSIKSQLLAEAHTFDTPFAASARLNELAGKIGVEFAVYNPEINANIFGSRAARDIEMARMHLMVGDQQAALSHMTRAQNTETSSSCPFVRKLIEEMSNDPNNPNAKSSEEAGGMQEMTCPYCTEKTTGDPCAANLTCKKCYASTSCSEKVNKDRAARYHRMKQARDEATRTMIDSIMGRDDAQQFTTAA